MDTLHRVIFGPYFIHTLTCTVYTHTHTHTTRTHTLTYTVGSRTLTCALSRTPCLRMYYIILTIIIMCTLIWYISNLIALRGKPVPSHPGTLTTCSISSGARSVVTLPLFSYIYIIHPYIIYAPIYMDLEETRDRYQWPVATRWSVYYIHSLGQRVHVTCNRAVEYVIILYYYVLHYMYGM